MTTDFKVTNDALQNVIGTVRLDELLAISIDIENMCNSQLLTYDRSELDTETLTIFSPSTWTKSGAT